MKAGEIINSQKKQQDKERNTGTTKHVRKTIQ